ncbi:hypothetical protein Hbl1158_08920 [Halobaculum sp. CBA1158]|uniref:hypothetical protein n=1 Tax=Halobaculum sp. CBA1158 TaxID=2904243 RepID=UPI001F19516A|nr:hypothetical protein [Halobaculum sp. CBA1158]UIO98676.1 hypothetical protein Hbl1158_08920 [Halobaculum sp. CBA1158]
MSPNATATLRAVAVAVVLLSAGCLGTPGVDTPDAGPATTESPATVTPTESPATPTEPTTAPTTTVGTIPDDCTPARPEGVDPVRDDVSPVAYPDAPAELTAEAAGEWAETFEEAYLRNDNLARDTVSFGASAGVENVTRVDGGYVVRVRASWYSNTGDVRTGTASPTVVHADSPVYLSTYLVTDAGARRASTTGGANDHPNVRDGTVVACF